MKTRGLATVVVAVLMGMPALASSPLQDPPLTIFRSSVDVVSVSAVVRDRKGRFVRDLDRSDFTVVEAGQTKPILDFRALTDGPVKLALLVDISGSMRLGRKAVDARQAAKQIFSALGHQDQAALFVFDTRLEQVGDFTSDVGTLEGALDRVASPYGRTSLYDAVAETARLVAGDRGHPSGTAQRRAVVVLTDGIDTGSRITPDQVAAIAGGIDVPVYVLAVMASVDDPRLAPEGPAAAMASSLARLSRGTGGELFTASAPAHASIAARQIVAELRHQYVLAFEASARSGWRPLEIRAKDREHIVRARAGYSAGSGDGE